jgi:nitroreductase
MEAIELLKTRASHSRLTEPAPDADTLQLALEAVTRTPDHAGLKPWRVRWVRGSARERLGDLMAECLQRANPSATEAELQRARMKALRAPLIIVVGAVLQPHPKVPEIEQLASAAAAAQNILLTLHARGYAGIWRTGAPAYDTAIKRAFGFEPKDALVAFIYAGTPTSPAPALKRATPEGIAAEWTGAQAE